MRESFKLNFILLLAAVFMLSYTVPVKAVRAQEAAEEKLVVGDDVKPHVSGRMPGAWVVEPSCNPATHPSEDSKKTRMVDGYYPDRSCVGQKITRDKFKIKVSFDPTQPKTGENFEVTIPAGLGLPDGVGAPFYDVNGKVISGATNDNLTFNGLGDQVLYKGQPIYTAPKNLKYPTSGNYTVPRLDSSGKPILDANGDPVVVNVKYSQTCLTHVKYDSAGSPIPSSTDPSSHEHPAGTYVQYENGMTLIGSNCEIIQDCHGNVVGGADIYMAINGSCQIARQSGQQINAVMTEETVKKINASVFTTVFQNDYSVTELLAIENLKPSLKSLWMLSGQTAVLHPVTRISFEMQYEDDMACVYAYMQDPEVRWRVEKKLSENTALYKDISQTGLAQDQFELTEKNPDGTEANVVSMPIGLGDAREMHCFRAPAPLPPPIKISFGSMISDTCTFNDRANDVGGIGIVVPGIPPGFESDAGSSDARRVGGETPASRWKHPFVGRVVQCVEETMMNIFIPDAGQKFYDAQGREVRPESFFTKMQDKMRGIIRALLALYIIFFGYKLMVGKEVPQQSEWMWMGLKFAMVVYFAMGSGMSDLLPSLLSGSRSLSAVVMEASLSDTEGNMNDAADKYYQEQKTYNALLEAYNKVLSEYYKAQDALQKNPNDPNLIAKFNEWQAKKNDAEDALNAANVKYESAKDYYNSFGYDYCDFRSVDYGDNNYPNMKLWDMVDCKLSKYLGIGDNKDNASIPQVLVMGVVAVFSTVYGFPILLLTLIFLIFIIMIIFRVVHVYILAVIAAVLLVYISPLAIPAVLFKHTKGMFDKWLSQLTAALIQPLLLFAFMAFMFAGMDMVLFGSNHNFVKAEDYPVKHLIWNKENNSQPATKASECLDEKALGCIYQVMTYKKVPYPEHFEVVSITEMNFTKGQDWYMVLGLLKLLLICFVISSVLALVEKLAATLAGSMGSGKGGLSSMASAPQSNVVGITNAVGTAIGKTVNLPFKAGSAVGKARKQIRSIEKGVNNRDQRQGEDRARKKAIDTKKTADRAREAHEEMVRRAEDQRAREANRQMMQEEARRRRTDTDDDNR